MSTNVNRKLATETLQEWVAVESRDELAWTVRSCDLDISLPQARRVESRLNELRAPARSFRVGILHTYTSDLLDPWLSFDCALQDLSCEVYHAPYGLLRQEAHAESGLVRHGPDLTLLLLQREDLHPDMARPLAGFSPKQQEALRQQALAELMELIKPLRTAVGGVLAVTFLPSMTGPGLGLFDAHSERSEVRWWSLFKAEAARLFREGVRSALLLDLDEPLALLGRERFFDPRLWYSARYPFSTSAAREIARRVAALGAVIQHPKAKVIVLDADNTLWGGIIGEDGIHGIALGPDYPGNAYVAFQRRLLDLQQRGFILAMCSKNNEADVDQVLKEHPHQVLRHEHFVARRVNWLPKPQNLESLAEELNVGLDSFIFVDDSQHECLAVRRALPQVEVVCTPVHPLGVPSCLDRLARLEIISLTDEDRAKTQMYIEERQRKDLERDVTQRGGDVASYLRSLEMRMQVGIDDSRHIARLAQLTQKTNQFNLTTRRYSDEQIRAFIESDRATVAHFSMADRFGNSGVVGLAILRETSRETAILDTFLMSCRVIGRGAESAFLETLLRQAHSHGMTVITAEFIPTAKNALVADFLPSHGFAQKPDGTWQRALNERPARLATDFPIDVTIERGASIERVRLRDAQA